MRITRRQTLTALLLFAVGCTDVHAQSIGMGMGMSRQNTQTGLNGAAQPIFHFNPEDNPGGIAALPSTLTVANGSSGTLLFDYDGADATTSTWTATTGDDLAITGSGDDPTPNTGSPTHGDGDDSVKGNAGKYYTAPDDGTGDVATEDLALEMVCQAPNNQFLISKRNATAGWAILGNNLQLRFTIRESSTTTNVNGDTLSADAWYHLMLFVDRSGSAQWYANGAASGTATSVSARSGTITTSAFLNVFDEGGGAPYSGACARLRGWTFTDIGTHSQADVAKERFARLTGTYHSGQAYSSFVRATGKSLLKEVSTDVYQSFLVGPGWPVVQNHPLRGAEYNPEPAATSILLHNYDFTANCGTTCTWTKLDAGDTIGGSVADLYGTTRTTLGIIGDTTDGQHGVSQAATVTAATWSYCCVFEPGDQTFAYLANTTVANATLYADISTCENGTDGAGATPHTPIDYGDKCQVGFSFTGTAAAHTFEVSPAEADGDNAFAGDGATVNVYAEHCKLELGSICTSLQPTTTASVTRNKDELRYVDYSPTPTGSLIASFTTGAPQIFLFSVSLNDDTVNNLMNLYVTNSATSNSAMFFTKGGVNYVNSVVSSSLTDGARHTQALSWQADNFVYFIDGVQKATDTNTSGETLEDVDEIMIGMAVTELQQLNGGIHEVCIFDVPGQTECP